MVNVDVVDVLVTGGYKQYLGREDYMIDVSEKGQCLRLYYASSEQGMKETIDRIIREPYLKNKLIKVEYWTSKNPRLCHW
jgi:molybdenum cofactor biosynthesis enzyme